MLYSIFIDIVAVTVVLGVMILVHEFGHFVAAKFFGVRVEVFSFGFGTRLVGVKKGDTDYRISLLPFGGYVKMAGETTGDEVTGSADEFQVKPRWQRFIIAVMGPAMNVILAILLLFFLFMFRYQKPAYEEGPALVGYVEPNSPAAAAGIQNGDRIVSLNGQANPHWGDIELVVASNVGQPLHVQIERAGQQMDRTVVPKAEGRAQLGDVGWDPVLPAHVQGVEPGLPAAAAGIRSGDHILAINGTPVDFWPRISEMVQQNEGKPLQVLYSRNGTEETAQLTPVLTMPQGETEKRWLIGVSFQSEMITRRLGPVAAFSESLAENKKFTVLIFEVVGKIFARELSPRSLEGPIGIAQVSGEAARQSMADFINLMAVISLNLGIFNLFPIPVLDGGLILLLLIEGTMRRDLSRATRERITQVGFAFLMLIFVYAIYNDIARTLPPNVERLFP